MDEKEKKQQRIDEVQELLEAFSKEYLSEELTEYVNRLWLIIGRKRTYSITGGAKEVWASAVIYVIARLNFLFDVSSPKYLSTDTICEFFNTKKSTVSQKATDIEKKCKILQGDERLCSQEISDIFYVVELPNGLILPAKLAREKGLIK